MIRLIGRRLIIPRGDTGSFTIPVLSKSESDSIGVFTIFNPVTKTRVFQKQVEVQGDVFNIEFNHGETVNLLAGDYLWDIKFYINPIIEDNKVIDGTEVDSYYAAFQIPKCEIRETGDDFMVIEGQPAKIEDLNIILAATAAANAAKIAATEKAEEVAARLAEMVAAIPTKVSELENDSGYLQEETDPTVPAWAKAPTKPSYTPQEVGALPADTFIPSKVSDLTDDSGHYIKPVNGIPASDLEETYLTQHQDISMKANSADLAAVATSGDYSDLDNTPYIPTKTSDLTNDSNYAVDSNYVHTDTNYTAAEKEKLAGIAAGAEVNVNADWNAISGDALILNKPTKVSDFQNDAGYLTQHQDISGKANAADLATVATSGSYNDLEDKPFIPSKLSDLTDDSGHYTKPAGGIPASDLAETYLTAHQDISGKADKSEIPTSVSELTNDVGYITGYTETDPTVPAWAKAAQKPSYTAAEVGAPTVAEMNTAIGNAIGNINSFDMAVVQELPTQDISTHTIYLVPKTGETNDVYNEYVYINNAWEMVGNTQIDLSDYALKSELPTRVSELNNDSGYLTSYTETDPTVPQWAKASTKPSYTAAEVGALPSDTHIPSTTAELTNDAGFITSSALPTKVSDLTNDAGYLTAHQDISGKANTADLATVATSGSYEDLSNKPTIPEVPVQDVQVNGTSVLQDGVANVPIADTTTAGVVRGSSMGVDVAANGELAIGKASSLQIKAGTRQYNPIVPSNQHESTFYGLAKAAGDTTQAASSNAVGQYTDAAKAAIKSMLGITQTITVTVLTQDNVTVTGQTVTVRAVDATGPIFATAAYEGQPVTFAVPSGFAYHVSVSDTLEHHFNPTTASGIITNTDVAITLQYSDVSTIRTATDIKAALNAGMDLTDLVGEQITCSKGDDTLSWDVVDYDSTNGSIMLLLHDAFGTANMVFEPAQALMWCENGLAAGSYTFADGSTHYYFTTSTALPAGGQLRATDTTYYLYASQASTGTLETGTVSTTEIAGATDLGTCAQGLLNHFSRNKYGSNNIAESAIQWWLNSDEAANVQRPFITKFQRPQSYNVLGFMNGLDQEFIDCLDEVDWKCSTNNVYECPKSLGGLTDGTGRAYTIKAKFCLASEMEIFGSYGGNPDGSTVFDLYNGADADDRKKYRGTTAQYWWLRSPNWGSAYGERLVGSSGTASNTDAYNSDAVLPACQISRDQEAGA